MKMPPGAVGELNNFHIRRRTAPYYTVGQAGVVSLWRYTSKRKVRGGSWVGKGWDEIKVAQPQEGRAVTFYVFDNFWLALAHFHRVRSGKWRDQY